MSKGYFIQKGETIDYKNAGASEIAYGDAVSLITRIGIAGETLAVGATGSLHVVGVFELPADATTAFAVGDALYWDVANSILTKTSAGMIPAGWCTETKAQAGATGRVKIG